MSWLPVRRLGFAAAVGVIVVGIAATGCTKKDPAKTDQDPSKVSMGTGVTADKIELGVLTDQSGPYKGLSGFVAAGRQAFWDSKNNTVCARKVEFLVRDHKYTTQGATDTYADVKDKVLMLHELLGSPEIDVLNKQLAEDKMVTGAVSWDSSLLANPYIVIAGTTYNVDMYNAVDWLTHNKGIAKGDKIGALHVEGAYGNNGLAGVKAAASAYGLELKDYSVAAAATDLTAQITAAKADGVKAVLVTTTPAQAGNAVAIAAGAGLDVPFVGSGPAYSASLLGTAAKDAILKNYWVTTSVPSYTATGAGAADGRKAIEAKIGAPGTVTAASQYQLFGYAQAQIVYSILDKACQQGTLTRDGLLKAFQSLNKVDTGVLPTLDYSKSGQIPSTKSYILKPDASANGTLVQVADLFAAPGAANVKP